MKSKAFFLSLIMGVLMLLTTKVSAQNIDSTANQNKERQEAKELQDEQRMDAAVDLKRDAKSEARAAKTNAREAKAAFKEADRVEDDASDAARQAKIAARTEHRAQKARLNADKQAKKAAKATEKSNNNK